MFKTLKTNPRWNELVGLSTAILVGQKDVFLTFANPETLKTLEELGLENSREAFYVANYLFFNGFDEAERRDSHDLWNDRFYLAYRFGLGEHEKKTSAICTVWNARNSTFQWTTGHLGYDNAELLKRLGIITEDEYRAVTGLRGYFRLEDKLHERIKNGLGVTEEEIKHAYLIDYDIGRKEGKYESKKVSGHKTDLFSPEE